MAPSTNHYTHSNICLPLKPIWLLLVRVLFRNNWQIFFLGIDFLRGYTRPSGILSLVQVSWSSIYRLIFPCLRTLAHAPILPRLPRFQASVHRKETLTLLTIWTSTTTTSTTSVPWTRRSILTMASVIGMPDSCTDYHIRKQIWYSGSSSSSR